MNVNDLYLKLDNIFIDYTTHNWKNGWQHEGDRLSKEFIIQKSVPWNNLFLLQQTHKYYGNGLSLDGPQGFKIEVYPESSDMIRIDIEAIQMADVDIYYYVDNEIDWLSNMDFILNLCQEVYDANVKIHECVSHVPKNLYGVINPPHAKQFRRDRLLDDLIS